MFLKSVTFAALLGAASAQMTMDLNQTLAANNLTGLASLVGMVPGLLTTLNSAQNITILAPSTQSITQFSETPEGAALASNPELLQAILQYHVLNGTFPAAAIPETPAFVPTLLTNPAYTNVTGGQVVEPLRSGQSVTVYSGLLQNVSVIQPVSCPPIPKMHQ